MSDSSKEPMAEQAPVILDRGHHPISRRDIDFDALKVLYRLHGHGFIAYLVGGAVRDLLVGRRPADFDIGTDAHPNQIKRLFRNAFLIGRRFRLAHIRFQGGKIIEVSTFRRRPEGDEPAEEPVLENPAEPAGLGPGDSWLEASAGPGGEPIDGGPDAAAGPEAESAAGPEQPATPGPPCPRPPLKPIAFGTPREDAFRRDITINALFYDIGTYAVIDYVGGLKDLEAGLIRIIGDPAESYQEDPVRMWRVLRHAARLDFGIEEATEKAILDMRDLLAKCAPSRLFEEFAKDIKSGASGPFFELVRRQNILPVILGGIGRLYQDYDALFRRLSGFLAAVDESVRRERTPPPEIAYSLFFWPWAEDVLAHAQGDKAKVLYDAFREAKPAVQFPRSLVLDAFQTLVIVEHMLKALATGRMKWALKKRAHWAGASRIVALITTGSLAEDEDAFDRLFRAKFPVGPQEKRRRRRPRRRRPDGGNLPPAPAG